jgi:Icc-related predicted phosphoesterase
MPWLRRLREDLNPLDVACILGNHDWLFTREYLADYDRRGELVLLTPDQFRQFNGVSFLGYSHTPPTPYWVKDFERLDLPGDPVPEMGGAVWDPVSQQPKAATPDICFNARACLANELRAAAETREPWIFVCHAPPHQTRLDRLPHIDYPVGSRAVRAFIEQRRPMCSLHGHIHESPGLTGAFCDRVGDTMCINPGQDNQRLHAVLFDTRDIRGTLRHTVYS